MILISLSSINSELFSNLNDWKFVLYPPCNSIAFADICGISHIMGTWYCSYPALYDMLYCTFPSYMSISLLKACALVLKICPFLPRIFLSCLYLEIASIFSKMPIFFTSHHRMSLEVPRGFIRVPVGFGAFNLLLTQWNNSITISTRGKNWEVCNVPNFIIDRRR